jgi:hypothetical protein
MVRALKCNETASTGSLEANEYCCMGLHPTRVLRMEFFICLIYATKRLMLLGSVAGSSLSDVAINSTNNNATLTTSTPQLETKNTELLLRNLTVIVDFPFAFVFVFAHSQTQHMFYHAKATIEYNHVEYVEYMLNMTRPEGTKKLIDKGWKLSA